MQSMPVSPPPTTITRLPAAEISVLSVRKTRLAELAEGGRRGAAAVRWLRDEPARFLATVQIGLTGIGTTAAAFGSLALSRHPGTSAMGMLLAMALAYTLLATLVLLPALLGPAPTERA